MSEPLLVRALQGKERTERAPVWIMRQAGRYMEAYRNLRKQHDFLTVCRTPELALEVTMQPIEYLAPDAAIIFSDILVLGEPLGFEMDFAPGPVIHNPIATAQDVSRMRSASVPSDLSYVLDAIRMTRDALPAELALLGFAGSPWTLACYFIERGPFKHFENALIFAKRFPHAFADLLDRLTESVCDLLSAQAEAGAHAVQLFDSWGGILSRDDYQRYSLPYIARINERLRKQGVPVILYLGGGPHLIDLAISSQPDCLSVDWRLSLEDVFRITEHSVAIQGNLNPAVLYEPEQNIREATRAMLAQVPPDGRYIANLGHGILQTTPPEHARCFVKTVQEGWPTTQSM